MVSNWYPMVYIFGLFGEANSRPQDAFEYELDAAVVRTLLVAKACPRGWDCWDLRHEMTV